MYNNIIKFQFFNKNWKINDKSIIYVFMDMKINIVKNDDKNNNKLSQEDK